MSKDGLIPSPIQDKNGKQTIVYKKPEGISSQQRFNSVPPKSAEATALEDLNRQLERAQEQVDQVRRQIDGAQRRFDEVREKMSEQAYFDIMGLINLTQTNARASAAAKLKNRLAYFSDEDPAAVRDVIYQFCTEQVAEIDAVFKNARSYGLKDSDVHGHDTRNAERNMFYTFIQTVETPEQRAARD